MVEKLLRIKELGYIKDTCGVIPAFVIAVPVPLPVCDGFERIEFEDDHAMCLHRRRIVRFGFIGTIGGGTSFNDPVCRHPLPSNNCVASELENSDEQFSP
jgi:hypothetical protein